MAHAPVDRPYGIAPPAFRLPDAAHVGRVHLQVSDLQRSVAYYRDVIGLRVYDATTEHSTLGPHGPEHPLVELRTGPGITPARRGALGLFHFAILVPDRAALGAFARHLASPAVKVGMADHLVSEALYLSDPDGLGIEVYADRPRSAWRHQDRELLMATDPLDIGGVIAAAGERHWEGMPAGTTIGHMHLHVGSLVAGEAFYHAGLGLDKMVWSYPGALFLAAGGYHHHLGTNVWSSGPSAALHEARLIEWDLVVPTDNSRAAAARSLTDAGYAVTDSGNSSRVADPWGTQLRIVSSSQVRVDPLH